MNQQSATASMPSPFNRYRHIVVEGPIGAGKTSLARLIGERFHAGLVGGRLGKGEFGLPQVAVGIVQRGGHDRATLLIGSQRSFAIGQFAFEPGQGFGGIAGQPVGIAAILFEPGALAIEGVRVLDARRHSRKLKRGTHRRNGFRIRLTGVEGSRAAAEVDPSRHTASKAESSETEGI